MGRLSNWHYFLKKNSYSNGISILEQFTIWTFQKKTTNEFLKLIFYKNNAKPPIVTRNLHDSAPYFGACLPEIWGQDRANFV